MREIHERYYASSTGNSEKFQAPDGIWTHDPPWSSTDALTTELLETLWWQGWNVGIDYDCVTRRYRRYTLMWMRNAVKSHIWLKLDYVNALCSRSQNPHFPLAHHRVSISSVVRASVLNHVGSWVQISSGAQLIHNIFHLRLRSSWKFRELQE